MGKTTEKKSGREEGGQATKAQNDIFATAPMLKDSEKKLRAKKTSATLMKNICL